MIVLAHILMYLGFTDDPPRLAQTLRAEWPWGWIDFLVLWGCIVFVSSWLMLGVLFKMGVLS